MLEYFKSLVRAEHPNYFIELKTHTCDCLSVVECKWAGDDKFYCASAFYTDAWIDKDLMGTLRKVGQRIRCLSGKKLVLSDVATVMSFNDLQSCKDYHTLDANDLALFLTKMHDVVDESISTVLVDNHYGDTFSVKLVLAPYPSVLITIKNGDDLVGTLMITGEGHASACFACTNRLYEYVRYFNKAEMKLFASPEILCLPGGGIEDED